MIAAIALALVLMFSLVSSAIATDVAILAPHKDGASAAVRTQMKKIQTENAKKIQTERCVGPYKSARDFWYDQKLCQ